MADSWEDRQLKKKPIGLAALALIAIIFIVFLIRNNSDVFTQDEDTVAKKETNEVIPPIVDTAERNETTRSGDEEKKADDTLERVPQIPKRIDPSEKSAAVVNAPVIPSIDLTGIICILADKKGLSIRVSLKLYFKEKELEKEILFKREDIKLIVRKAFSTKHLSDVVVDVIRAELQKEINGILKQGRIIDIEFLDFSPIE